MSLLAVTFCKGYRVGTAPTGKQNAPVPVGDSPRTEQIPIDSSTTQGSLESNSDEGFLILKAGAECYVTVGVNPVAVDGEGWHLFANERHDLLIQDGWKVAVIAASESLEDGTGGAS